MFVRLQLENNTCSIICLFLNKTKFFTKLPCWNTNTVKPEFRKKNSKKNHWNIELFMQQMQIQTIVIAE